MKPLTRQQRLAIKRLYDRNHNGCMTYLQFRRRAVPGFDCVMIPWCRMWLGIELNGYTHS